MVDTLFSWGLELFKFTLQTLITKFSNHYVPNNEWYFNTLNNEHGENTSGSSSSDNILLTAIIMSEKRLTREWRVDFNLDLGRGGDLGGHMLLRWWLWGITVTRTATVTPTAWHLHQQKKLSFKITYTMFCQLQAMKSLTVSLN